MTTYQFVGPVIGDGYDLNDPNYYINTGSGERNDGFPGSGDTVDFSVVGSGYGTLSINDIQGSFTLRYGSVTANSATGFTTAGDNQGSAVLAISGTIDGDARSYQGGDLTAQLVTGTIQALGGDLTLTSGFYLQSHGTGSNDLVSSNGGHLTVEGGLGASNNARILAQKGTMEIQGDVTLETGANLMVGDFSGKATFTADSLSVGGATAQVDECGNFTYLNGANDAAFSLSSNGYVSIGGTLSLQNAADVNLNLLSTHASLEVGGNDGAVDNQLTVDSGGHLIVGHGYVDATTIHNQGIIETNQGRLVLNAAFTAGSTGTVQVDDYCSVVLNGAFHGTLNFKDVSKSFFTTAVLGNAALYSASAHGITFGGELTGLTKGVTLELVPGTWGALANDGLAHTEVVGSDLIVHLDTGRTVTYGLGESFTGVVNIRQLPDTHISLTVTDANSKVVTGVDGAPTGNAYVDSLITGWAKWDASQPITYYFGETADVHDAIGEHGETNLLQCDDPQLVAWSSDAKAAFVAALQVLSSATGLTFQEASGVGEANLVWWMKPTLPTDEAGTTLGESEFVSQTPGGHLWQYFNGSVVNVADYLAFGGIGFQTIIHEICHSLGLAHPHDGGPEADASLFPGVVNGSVGTNGQNQGVYTIMSYNKGWNGAPVDNAGVYGNQGGLGAFDIAALQELYGANLSNEGGDTDYALQTVNGTGTGWKAIWDTGGTDTITNAGSDFDATIDLRAAPLVGANAGGYLSHVAGVAGGFTIASGVLIENGIGGNGNDQITGNGADNRLEGNDGNDILRGGAGADTQIGGIGNDTFQIAGVEGLGDSMDGGTGTDRLQVLGTSDTTLAGFSAALSSIEQWVGNGHGLFGTADANLFDFSALTAKTGLSFANGGGGDDVLIGSHFADALRGGDGKDQITGGAGKDIDAGGTGADRFIFTKLTDSKVNASLRDTITDFKHAQHDRIDLRAIDAKTGGGNQTFHFIGKSAFHHKKGELHYSVSHGNATVSGDVNGDGKADFAILLNHVSKLIAGDFFL